MSDMIDRDAALTALAKIRDYHAERAAKGEAGYRIEERMAETAQCCMVAIIDLRTLATINGTVGY